MKGRTIPQEVIQGNTSLTVVFSREVQPLPHCGLAGLEQREEMPQLLSLIPPISSWYAPPPRGLNPLRYQGWILVMKPMDISLQGHRAGSRVEKGRGWVQGTTGE